jgi:hypothetical protein
MIAREAVTTRSDYCYPQPNHSRLTHINFGRCSTSRAVLVARPKMLGAAYCVGLIHACACYESSIAVPSGLFQ